MRVIPRHEYHQHDCACSHCYFDSHSDERRFDRLQPVQHPDGLHSDFDKLYINMYDV